MTVRRVLLLTILHLPERTIQPSSICSSVAFLRENIAIRCFGIKREQWVSLVLQAFFPWYLANWHCHFTASWLLGAHVFHFHSWFIHEYYKKRKKLIDILFFPIRT